jgi:hypothetical protein
MNCDSGNRYCPFGGPSHAVRVLGWGNSIINIVIFTITILTLSNKTALGCSCTVHALIDFGVQCIGFVVGALDLNV